MILQLSGLGNLLIGIIVTRAAAAAAAAEGDPVYADSNIRKFDLWYQ